MTMADGSNSYEWQFDDFDVDVGGDVTANDDDMSMDIESFLSILDEASPDGSSQNGLAGPPSSVAPCSYPTSHVGANEHSQTHNGSVVISPSDHSQGSVYRTVCSTGSCDSERQMVNLDFTKVESQPDGFSSMNLPSRTLADWEMPVPGLGFSQGFPSLGHNDTRETDLERGNSNETFGLSDGNGNHQWMDTSGITDGIYSDSVADSCKTSEAFDNVEGPHMGLITYSNFVYEPDDGCSMPYFMGTDESSYFGPSSQLHPVTNGGGMLHNVHESSLNTTLGHSTSIDSDDDPDVCVREDMSEPAHKKQFLVDGKSVISAQRSSSPGAPPTHVGYNNARLKTNDERFIYRVALQDLSQPKSEASPPQGALAVPLLRHQRIALSWMVQKETKSIHCFGGILADDQGLGKTISTIALILKERSPSSNVHTTEKAIETLNLDDEESCATIASVQATSRPAAGTLVVCPTSVLRQWNDELHNKVTTEANLSVLVYHGGNRTKDPFELAKYDVVLTTYAIVSMEVPKQPLVDDYLPVGPSSGNKRKYSPTSGKKGKMGIDSELFESLSRPLAKVRWFRVILDEAQSIKNHKTQVARACWGLRAKRRWCLSGTPIQNSIDDLYSYFRFLKYDPYAVYKSFCETIKAPIQRSPVIGYRKLQAVLKTIMLRRTKGTLLDGEPVISLPPKTVNLKKVDFTTEERDFYCRLEADSRAQFAEYAAAGTVKQNYVNILLMLLRLRQACDHPLLVRGCNSNLEWKLSVEKAKTLAPEKRNRLLNCLEASLAICSICNDPPEDPIVTTCEHVFCNQCILEHLSNDENTHCPSSKCKTLIARSSVFTKSTLRISVDGSVSIKPEAIEPCSSNSSVGSSKTEASEALDSSKIKAALEVLQSISVFDEDTDVKVREKAIVFSQWTRMLDLLEACLKDSSIGYRRLDGTMSVVARDKAVKDFNTLPEVTVMIMSLKAASLGLNMVAACHVILLDLWWNPTTEDQAIDRAHRIGQTRPVTVVRLTVKDTVEDRILALQQKKREMVSSAFGEDETGSRQTRLTVNDLKYLFQA